VAATTKNNKKTKQMWITPNSPGCTIKQEIEWERFG